jgi:hypothetical protein
MADGGAYVLLAYPTRLEEAHMHVLSHLPATRPRVRAAVAALAALAALVAASSAHAAEQDYQIKTMFGDRALTLTSQGVSWQPAVSPAPFNQRWTRIPVANSPGALFSNRIAIGTGCLAVPLSATATTLDLLTVTDCSGVNDPRKQWGRYPGDPSNDALTLRNVKTRQQAITFGSIAGAWPETQSVDPMFNEFRFIPISG